jgi:hypothetical protein
MRQMMALLENVANDDDINIGVNIKEATKL